jgi:hypothetical protein
LEAETWRQERQGGRREVEGRGWEPAGGRGRGEAGERLGDAQLFVKDPFPEYL